MDQGTRTRPSKRPAPRWGDYELAGIGTRLVASIVDALLAGLVTVAVNAAAGFGPIETTDLSPADRVRLLTIGTIVALAYFPPQMVRWHGQTVGKRALRIKVVRESGEPMTWAVAIFREVVCKTLTFGLAIVDVVVPGVQAVGLIDYLWVVGDRQNRALHDMAARTRVVRVPR
jgi:uncharacterized RDD family membrane protein YckC